MYYWRCANAEWINDGEKNDTKNLAKDFHKLLKHETSNRIKNISVYLFIVPIWVGLFFTLEFSLKSFKINGRLPNEV